MAIQIISKISLGWVLCNDENLCRGKLTDSCNYPFPCSLYTRMLGFVCNTFAQRGNVLDTDNSWCFCEESPWWCLAVLKAPVGCKASPLHKQKQYPVTEAINHAAWIMSKLSKQQAHLHKPFIQCIWITTKLMKIKRSTWIICQQEVGLQPFNRWLAERNVPGSVFLEGKRGGRLEWKLPGDEPLLPTHDQVSFCVVHLHHAVSSCDCCFQVGRKPTVWEAHIATKREEKQMVKNKGLIDFCFARGEPDVSVIKKYWFPEMLALTGCCLWHTTGWQNQLYEGFFRYKPGQVWKEFRRCTLGFRLFSFSYFSPLCCRRHWQSSARSTYSISRKQTLPAVTREDKTKHQGIAAAPGAAQASHSLGILFRKNPKPMHHSNVDAISFIRKFCNPDVRTIPYRTKDQTMSVSISISVKQTHLCLVTDCWALFCMKTLPPALHPLAINRDFMHARIITQIRKYIFIALVTPISKERAQCT